MNVDDEAAEERRLNLQRVERRVRMAFPQLTRLGTEVDVLSADEALSWLGREAASAKAGLWLELDDITQVGLSLAQLFDLVTFGLEVCPVAVTTPVELERWLDEFRMMIELP